MTNAEGLQNILTVPAACKVAAGSLVSQNGGLAAFARTGTGEYTLTLAQGADVARTIPLVSIYGGPSVSGSYTVRQPSTTSVLVSIKDGGVATDLDFGFILAKF